MHKTATVPALHRRQNSHAQSFCSLEEGMLACINLRRSSGRYFVCWLFWWSCANKSRHPLYISEVLRTVKNACARAHAATRRVHVAIRPLAKHDASQSHDFLVYFAKLDPTKIPALVFTTVRNNLLYKSLTKEKRKKRENWRVTTGLTWQRKAVMIDKKQLKRCFRDHRTGRGKQQQTCRTSRRSDSFRWFSCACTRRVVGTDFTARQEQDKDNLSSKGIELLTLRHNKHRRPALVLL